MIEDSELIARQRRDTEDLNNEIAGRDVGRRARFLNEDANAPDVERKKREARAFQNRLMELLNDPIYRAKYDGVMQALSDAEQATQAALDQLNGELDAAETTRSEMMDNAARLPDGTRVFKDANGVVRSEDGTVVEDYLADTILWTGQEPSYEDIQAINQHIDDVKDKVDAANGYVNDVLGPARDKITDPENPPSEGELDDIMDGIQSGMPDVVAAQLPQQTPVVSRGPDPASVPLPDLGSKP